MVIPAHLSDHVDPHRGKPHPHAALAASVTAVPAPRTLGDPSLARGPLRACGRCLMSPLAWRPVTATLAGCVRLEPWPRVSGCCGRTAGPGPLTLIADVPCCGRLKAWPGPGSPSE